MHAKNALLLVCALFATTLAARAAAPASLFIEELTWTELRDLVAAGKTTVIIPIGGTEQNGPHMVMGKHNYVITFAANEMAKRLGNALVAPTVKWVPEGDYNEAANSADDFQIGLSPGNFKNLPPEIFIWVPSVDPDTLREVVLAAKQKEKGYTLEVRLPVSFLFQNVSKRVGVEPLGSPILKRISKEQLALQKGVLNSAELKAGFRMGLMLDGSDCDAAHQPQKCLLSTSTERQWGDPTTFNTLELK